MSEKPEGQEEYNRWLVVCGREGHWMVSGFPGGIGDASWKPHALALFNAWLSAKRQGLLDEVFLCEIISDSEAVPDDKEHTEQVMEAVTGQGFRVCREVNGKREELSGDEIEEDRLYMQHDGTLIRLVEYLDRESDEVMTYMEEPADLFILPLK